MAVNPNGYVLWENSAVVVIAVGFKKRSKNTKTGAMIQLYSINKWSHPIRALETGADANVCFKCAMRPGLPVRKPQPDWQLAQAKEWRTFSVGDPVAGQIVCPASKERGHKLKCIECNLCGGLRARTKRSITIKPHGKLRKQYKCYVPMRAVAAVWRCFRRGGYANLDSVERFRGREVRFGAYGEPTLLPLDLVRAIAGVASSYTGYTHRWRESLMQGYREFFMASTVS